MNDFEWRRQLRDLRQPQTPRRDLWAGIEQALDGTSAGAPRHGAREHHASWWLAAGLAAVTVLAIGLTRSIDSAPPRPAFAAAPAWKPADPRLAGAAIELTAAQIELRQAIQQSPDSSALQHLLDLTEKQQARLRRLGQDAG